MNWNALVRFQCATLLHWCVLSTCPSLWAATYVVSPLGDDAQSGTWEAPLKSISAAATKAQAGDTVLVREGVYRERVAPPRGGRPGSPIVYRGEAGKRVIVKGSDLWQPGWTHEGHGIYSAHPKDSMFNDIREDYVDSHNPLKVELASTPFHREGKKESDRGFDGDASLVFTCGQVFVSGEPLREVPFKGELEANTWWYDADAELVFLHLGGRDPHKCEIELTTRRRIFAPTKRGLGHIVVEGFVFEHCGNQYPTNFWTEPANAQRGAVGTEAGHHWVIRHNVIRFAKTFALDVGRVNTHDEEDSSYDNLVEENYLIDNGSAGVMSCGSRNLVIRKNVILRNNGLHFLGEKRWEQAGIKCHLFVDGLIEGNYIAHNHDTYGIWLDNEFPDSRITGNVIHDNGRAGVFLEMSDYGFDRLLVDRNLIFDNVENAVYIHDASGATFVKNLLANTKNTPGYGQALYIRQVKARAKTGHHSFFGNLFIGNAKNIEVNYPAYRSGPLRFEENLYDVDPNLRTFVINSQSDVPRPLAHREFRARLQADLAGHQLPDAAEQVAGKVFLKHDEWRAFWQSHGEPNDFHSVCTAGNSVSYDEKSRTLTIQLSAIPPTGSDTHLKPTLLSGLTRGSNRRVVWNGLPLVEKGELPRVEWQR
ncbi:right-handed parallel beta-helix repeat-containing protein [Aeoliella sp. SH292]|uniref:right-handed parallel beta-helix repeat-containing protein n=1 Tax=Aeoliella sp. SH292 TaxID=3454464 RepID=UPI003F94965D